MLTEGTTRYIDAVQFGEKLAGPLIHINAILRFCTNPKYQDSLTKTFRIRIVPNPPASIDMPTQFDNWTKTEVAAFLHRSYMSIWPYGDPEGAIDHLSGIIMDNIGKSRISGPHCECLLMQHHHSEAGGEPIMASYIGASKPSCLQCGLFLDAYNETVPNGPLFFIRSRANHTYPSVVPFIDAVMDASIVEKMRVKLNKLIATIVDVQMQKIGAARW